MRALGSSVPVALRAAFAPLEHLRRSMRAVDLSRLGTRLQAAGPQEVRELVDVFIEQFGEALVAHAARTTQRAAG